MIGVARVRQAVAERIDRAVRPGERLSGRDRQDGGGSDERASRHDPSPFRVHCGRYRRPADDADANCLTRTTRASGRDVSQVDARRAASLHWALLGLGMLWSMRSAGSGPRHAHGGAMSTVLVTGGSGFIGGHCILQLLAAGHRVRTTVRNLAREPEVRTLLKRGGVEAGRPAVFRRRRPERDAGWPQAVAGCDFVLHVASPFPAGVPKHEDELIIPARDGALRVLRAARAAGVKRVVLTSSFAAIGYGHNRRRRRSTRRTGPISRRRGVRPSRSRRPRPSARPGISSRRRAGSNSPSSIRSACSVRCSAPIRRPRSSSSSA